MLATRLIQQSFFARQHRTADDGQRTDYHNPPETFIFIFRCPVLQWKLRALLWHRLPTPAMPHPPTLASPHPQNQRATTSTPRACRQWVGATLGAQRQMSLWISQGWTTPSILGSILCRGRREVSNYANLIRWILLLRKLKGIFLFVCSLVCLKFEVTRES